MTIDKTSIQDLLIITPKVFNDSRGYFTESYNERTLRNLGIRNHWVQDNQSLSVYGVIRGLHFQKPPHVQAKLVRVIAGEIFDVAVDLRPDSPTFGRWEGVKLSGENFRQLYIPAGFAHGFSVLSHEAIVFYKCDGFYHPESDSGIHHADTHLNIDWGIPENKRIVSEKDNQLPRFDPAGNYFVSSGSF